MKMHNKLLIILGLFALSLSSISQAQTNTMVGVQVGDSFQFHVLKNDFTSSQVQQYLNDLIKNFSSFVPSTDYQYNFSSVLNSLNQTMPSAGTIMTVNVTALPVANTFSGELSISYGQVDVNVVTGFLIGTPVVFTDWGYWYSMLNAYNGYSSSGFYLQTSVANDTSTFNATVKISTNNVPESLQQYGYTSVSAGISASYNVTSGVLNQETLTVNLVGQYSTTFTFSVSRYNEPASFNTSQPSPGFEALGLFAGMAVLAVVYNKKKN